MDLEGPSHRGYQLLAVLISHIGVFCFGSILGWAGLQYISLYPSYSHYMTQKFHPTEYAWQWTYPMLPLGAACSSLPMGVMMKKYGSRTLMLFHLMPYLFGWSALIFGSNIFMICFGRFLLGICGAALSMGVPVYTGEISRLRERGAWLSLYFGSIIYGLVLVNLVANFLNVKIANTICMMMTGLSFFLVILPQSPVYYTLHDDPMMALIALSWLHGRKPDNGAQEYMQMLAAKQKKQKEEDVSPVWWRSSAYRRAIPGVVRVTILMLFCELSGGIIINVRLRDVLPTVADSSFNIYLFFNWFALITGHLVCFLVVDRIGRRTLLLISSVLMLGCMVFLCIWFKWFLNVHWKAQPAIALFCYSGSFAMGVGPVTWILYVELIPEDLRPYGCSCAASMFWLSSALMQTKVIYNSYPFTEFYILLIVSILNVIFVVIFIPETKGLSSEEIHKKFTAKKVLELSSSNDS